MLNETINSIIDAESRAEIIEKEATDKARKLLKDATDKADKLKADIEAEVKLEVRKMRDSWDRLAEEKAELIIKEALVRAEAFIDESKTKIDELAEYVAKTVIEKYNV